MDLNKLSSSDIYVLYFFIKILNQYYVGKKCKNLLFTEVLLKVQPGCRF